MANNTIPNFSPSEKEIIAKIRDTVPPVHSLSDGYILRWLRANSGSLNKTCAALEKHMTFRKAWCLDELRTNWNYPQVLEKYCGYGFTGVDKTGCPVLISLFGNMDVEGIMKSIQSQDYVKYSLRSMEEGLSRCEKRAKESGKPFEQMLIIFNLENMTASHYSYKPFTNSFLTLLSVYQEHYPLAIKKIIVIKSPSMAQYAYKLLTPFLSESTQQTIEMPGDDWLSTIYQYVDPEEWPAFWGGNKLDCEGSSKLPTEIRLGLGPVPDAYFIDGDTEMTQCENITVYAGDKHLVEIETRKPCVRLSWQYKTATEDIGFAIYYDASGSAVELSEMKPVYPYIRLECSLVPVSGTILCETTGRYVVEFDNYYSWFSAKELAYNIDAQEL